MDREPVRLHLREGIQYIDAGDPQAPLKMLPRDHLDLVHGPTKHIYRTVPNLETHLLSRVGCGSDCRHLGREPGTSAGGVKLRVVHFKDHRTGRRYPRGWVRPADPKGHLDPGLVTNISCKIVEGVLITVGVEPRPDRDDHRTGAIGRDP